MGDTGGDSYLRRLKAPVEWARYLKTTNRFFLPSDQLVAIDSIVRTVEQQPTVDMADRIFWRARKHRSEQEDAYPADEMGAPPVDSARSGRVSPEGIPCLYLADSRETAIAEMRPWKGAVISVACFKLRKLHKFADLRWGERIWNELKQHDAPTWELWDFIMAQSVSFSKPAQEDSPVDYVPTQYLSARLKHEGYDGIIYESVMHEKGFNLAIFDVQNAADLVGDIQIYEVQTIEFTAKTKQEIERAEMEALTANIDKAHGELTR